MTKLSKKNFLNNFSTNSNLHKKTLKAGAVDWSNIKQYPNDYYAADTGAVSGMIYYSDTVKFAKKNHLEILQVLQDFEESCGTGS